MCTACLLRLVPTVLIAPGGCSYVLQWGTKGGGSEEDRFIVAKLGQKRAKSPKPDTHPPG